MLRPARDVFVQHQPLPEQRMRAVLHRVRPQPPVITQALPCRAQQGQQSNRQCTEQKHPVPTLRTRYTHRRHPHPETHVLEVAKARLNPPALGVVANQRACADFAFTGHQAPRLLHLAVLHTDHRAHFHFLASPHPSPRSVRERLPSPTHCDARRRSLMPMREKRCRKTDESRIRCQALRFESDVEAQLDFTSNVGSAMLHLRGLHFVWYIVVPTTIVPASETTFLSVASVSQMTPYDFAPDSRTLRVVYPHWQ